MPSPIKHRLVALVGLAGMIPIGLGLVQGSITLPTAAFRAAVLIAVLAVLEALLVPLARILVAAPERRAAPSEALDHAE